MVGGDGAGDQQRHAANTTRGYCWGYPSVAPSVGRMTPSDSASRLLTPSSRAPARWPHDCRAASRNLRLERAARAAVCRAPEHPLRGLPARGRQARHPGQRGRRPPAEALYGTLARARRRAPADRGGPSSWFRLSLVSRGLDTRVTTSQAPSCRSLDHRHRVRWRGLDQWNESPQAQEPVALGLSIVKPCFSMVSTKSIIAPLR